MANNNNDPLDFDEREIMAGLCYLGVLVLIPLFMQKKSDPFIHFHIKQGLVMLAALILALILSAWVMFLGNLLFIIVMLIDIVALIQALLGRWWKIPLVGNLADRFKI